MTIRQTTLGAFRPLAITALLTAALLVPVSTGAAGPGGCISAVIPDAIVLPDGSVHEAGKLRVCYSRDYSPVAGLHQTYINGRAVGMFISQHSATELTSDTDEAFFVFRRTGFGELELEGYAMPNGNGLDTFLIGASRKPGSYDVISHWQRARNSATTEQDDDTAVVLLAARTN